MKRYRVKVIPRSSKNEVFEIASDELKVKLTAPPVEGKANEALIKVLSEYFKIKKSAIRVTSGLQSRIKVVEIDETV